MSLSTWCVSDRSLIELAWDFISWLRVLFVFEPSSFLHESWWQEQRQMSPAWSGSLFGWWATTTTFIASEKHRIHRAEGRKQWNWAGTVALNNAEGRLPGFMVWDPAPNPHHRSLFLPATYCSLHSRHYEPRLLKEARQNNETMRPRTVGRGARAQQLTCGL